MPKRIDELTNEHREMFPGLVQEWTDRGLSTEPTDFPKFKTAVDECYRKAKLAPPKTVIAVASPVAAILVVGIVVHAQELLKARTEKSQRGAVGDAVDVAVYGAVGDAVDDAVAGAVYGAVAGAVYGAVYGAVDDAVCGAVGGAVGDAVGGAVRGAVRDAVAGAKSKLPIETLKKAQSFVWSNFWGAFNAGWQSYVDFYRRAELELTEDIWQRADAYRDAQMSCGWWYPMTTFVVVSDRPAEIHRDEQGRLHCEDGLAIKYRDGWGVWSWHGTRIPPEQHWIITNPERITAERIDEEKNQEVKRIMLERLTVEKYLLTGNAEPIDSDLDALGQPRTLYRKQIDGTDITLFVLHVKNSTPEPDGTTKDYFLEIHPECRPLTRDERGEIKLGKPQAMNCQNAVASTFGMTGAEYAPLVQT